VRRQLFDLRRRGQAAPRRLDDDEHRVDEVDRRAAQMLDARVHIQDQHLVLAEEQVREQRLEHRALRADAARSTQIDRAHLQQPYTAMRHAEAIGDVVDARVDLEEATYGPGLGAGALLDQVVHLGDRAQPGAQLGWEAERPGQAGRRVGVRGQHHAPCVGVHLSQQRRQRRLAHSSLAGNRQLHRVTSVLW